MKQPFPYRGFMLDSARHFMPVQDVCRLIEAAAVSGMNRMHWHLTDDQGWRLEIKKYPLLTQIGSVRGESYFGNASPTENNCGFYTQEDVGHVVAFAKDKGIEIVPEIEVPGHASAMLAAYPQYGCRRLLPGGETQAPEQAYPYQVITWAGVFPNLICAGRDDAVQFLLDILDEVADLFPGPEVHIGGDEAVKMHWRRCPDCQKRIREEHLQDEHALQRWLVLKCGGFLAQRGKKTIVWNESLQGGLLPKHFIVQHWLGNDTETAAFMESGGQVICSDVGTYYISRLYSLTDVHDIWAAPLIPAYAKGHEENLLGLECPLWTERITNTERAAFLLFPRLPAVALKAMRGEALGSYEAFTAMLSDTQKRIEALGLMGAPRGLWQMPKEAAEAEQASEQALRQSPRMQRVFEINDGMLLEDALEDLLRQIDMPREFALWIMDCAWAGQTPFSCGVKPEKDRGAQEAAEQLLTAIENRRNGPWKDLPREIMIDTLKCFSRFVREYFASWGEYGFDRGFWTTRQISAKLFRIGELEYELLEEKEKPLLSLHIPSDARLEPALLDESVQKARDFLGRFFPQWQNAPIHCESWLLSLDLESLLPPSSRILGFQRAFDITPCPDGALGDVLQWVYRLTPPQQKTVRLDALPESTALQRSMKQYLLSGKTFHPGSGYLTRPFSKKEQVPGGHAD